MAASLSTREIARELADYEIELPEAALAQLSTYLDLLLRWNRRVNLTGLREPRQIVRRLFGESLCLSRVVELRGWLVDVGSGAGFPGLALKLAAPDLCVTLIEARQRKCAFLKEVARECRFYGVDVVSNNLEHWMKTARSGQKADFITTRAVKPSLVLLHSFADLLAPEGRAVFFTTWELVDSIRAVGVAWQWIDLQPIRPSSRNVLLVGKRVTSQ